MMKANRETQILRLLIERRGELAYDLKRNSDMATVIADELTQVNKAIAELEGERLGASINDD